MKEKPKSPFVINYSTDKNIEVVSGNLNLDALKVRLPNLYDRFLAMKFLNRKSEKYVEQSEETLAIWFFRAALSEFQNISYLLFYGKICL